MVKIEFETSWDDLSISDLMNLLEYIRFRSHSFTEPNDVGLEPLRLMRAEVLKRLDNKYNVLVEKLHVDAQ